MADVIKDTKDRMQKCVEHLEGDLRGIKSGRATPGLVDSIRVDYYGSQTPLKQVANIGAPEPAMLVIKPFDASLVGEIEKAILKSGIGITPQSDGKVIRLPVPALSEEQRKKYVKLAKDKTEAQRVAIRNVRRDAIKAAETLIDDGKVPEDQGDRLKKEIEDVIKDYTKKLDGLLEAKTKELME